jgi:nucleotide-binding universal stress UspA family protein
MSVRCRTYSRSGKKARPRVRLLLREAIKLTTDQNSHLRLFHIVNEHVLDADYCIGTYEGDVIGRLRASGQEVVREAEGLLRQAGLKPDAVVREFGGQSAADAILQQAKDWPADLIVMGTHGRRGVRRLTMGSDAECVVREAAVPVLLVRASE